MRPEYLTIDMEEAEERIIGMIIMFIGEIPT